MFARMVKAADCAMVPVLSRRVNPIEATIELTRGRKEKGWILTAGCNVNKPG